jgi:hypothetical protein
MNRSSTTFYKLDRERERFCGKEIVMIGFVSKRLPEKKTSYEDGMGAVQKHAARPGQNHYAQLSSL